MSRGGGRLGPACVRYLSMIEDNRVPSYLIDLLSHRDESVANQAWVQLTRLTGQQLPSPLDAVEEWRRWVYKNSRSFASDRDRQVAGNLVEMMRDEDMTAGYDAWKQLSCLTGQRFPSPLDAVSQWSHWWYSSRGVFQLDRRRCLGAEEAEDELADRILRRYSFDVLPNPAIEIAQDHAAVLRHIFESRRREADRLMAYRLYVQMEAPGYDELVVNAVKEPSARIRGEAARDLPLALSGDKLVTFYIDLLSDPSTVVRAVAAEAMERRPSTKAIGPLVRLLGDSSIETRDRAAVTLSRWAELDLPWAPQVQEALNASRNSTNLTVAGAANVALTRYGKVRQTSLPSTSTFSRSCRNLWGRLIAAPMTFLASSRSFGTRGIYPLFPSSKLHCGMVSVRFGKVRMPQ